MSYSDEKTFPIAVTWKEDYNSDPPESSYPPIMQKVKHQDSMWRYARRHNLRAFFMDGVFRAAFFKKEPVSSGQKDQVSVEEKDPVSGEEKDQVSGEEKEGTDLK